jgi:hypothetical protein
VTRNECVIDIAERHVRQVAFGDFNNREAS